MPTGYDSCDEMYFDGEHFEITLDTVCAMYCQLCVVLLFNLSVVVLFLYCCRLTFQLNNYFQDDEETDEEFQDIAEHKILEVAGQ